jgi:hypothetical protein
MTFKQKLIKLLDGLTESQIEYIYYLTKRLFCHAAD